MAAETPLGVGRRLEPGLGLGWTRVAEAVRGRVPAGSIERIWLFAPVRREEREWGTAVVACRTESLRRRVLTASYILMVRGRERGQGRVTVEEVGESPVEVLHEVLAGVQERAGEPDPPVEIAPELWYGDEGDESATEG
jgi:hypothetical protein